MNQLRTVIHQSMERIASQGVDDADLKDVMLAGFGYLDSRMIRLDGKTALTVSLVIGGVIGGVMGRLI